MKKAIYLWLKRHPALYDVVYIFSGILIAFGIAILSASFMKGMK